MGVDVDADFVSARADEVEKNRPVAIESLVIVEAARSCCRITCLVSILIMVLSNL